MVGGGGIVTTQEEHSLYTHRKQQNRILDGSTRQHNTGSSHVTGETDQGLLAAARICVSVTTPGMGATHL